MIQMALNTVTPTNQPILFDALNNSLFTGLVIVGAYLFLLRSSGTVVQRTLDYAGVKMTTNRNNESNVDGETGTDAAEDSDTDTDEDTGKAIGKIENVLVLTLMVLQAYTALGVIFAAKSIVRKGDMDGGNTSYYLTGTLANFTYSIAVGVVLHVLLWISVRYGLF